MILVFSLLLSLALGLSIGVVIGAIYETENNLGVITLSDLMSLAFTIIGGAGGFVAAFLALYIWWNWKQQTKLNEHYSSKVNSFRLLTSLQVQLCNMAVMQANRSNRKFEVVRNQLIETVSELNTELLILDSIGKDLPGREGIDTNRLRLLAEIASDTMNLSLFPDIDTVDYLSVSSSTLWNYDRSEQWFERLPHTINGNLKIIQIRDYKLVLKSTFKDVVKELESSL